MIKDRVIEVVTYRNPYPMRFHPAWADIEVTRTTKGEKLIYSMLTVTNGCSWAVDPATVERHACVEDAAASFGDYKFKFHEFEEFNREEYVD